MCSCRYPWDLLNPPVEDKEKKPDDLGDRLHSLNHKYFNQFWLLVNGSPWLGPAYSLDGEKLVNPAIFWQFLEK